MNTMLSEIIELSEVAGAGIMRIYKSQVFNTVLKEDSSPLTAADTVSHDIIAEGLKKRWPKIPVLSEESKTVDFDVRKGWKEYWLIDPLDGTKEFIRGNGEFTVNIALIQEHTPVLGVVHAPVLGVTYFAQTGKGAFKKDMEDSVSRITSRRDLTDGLKVVSSRLHQGSEQEFFHRLGTFECLSMGSSLKFCLVAEGKAHLYPRFLPTSEWDTAAAQCIAEEAGAEVVDLGGRPLRYNKMDLLNPSFIVSSMPQDYWQKAV